MTRTQLALAALALAGAAITGAHAQTFERALGSPGSELANFVAPRADGGYIITGRDGSLGANAPYVARVNAADFIVWQRVINGIADATIHDVVEAPDAGVVLTLGYSGQPGLGRAIMKLDANGNTVWRRIFPGAPTLADIKVAPVPGGGYIFTGVYLGVGVPSRHPVLTRVDENGALIWTRAYTHATLGPNLDAQFEDVEPITITRGADPERAFIAVGTLSTIGAPNDQGRALVTLVDSGGDVIWAFSYGFADNRLLEAVQVDQAANEDFLVSGNDLAVGNGNSYLMRLDPAGILLWETAYLHFGTGGSMYQLADGSVIMCGRTRDPAIPPGQSETVLIKINPLGVPLWARAYGGMSFAFGLDAAPVGAGFVCLGSRLNGNPSGSSDIQWVRTDADGRTGCERDEPTTPVTRNPARAAEPLAAATLTTQGSLPAAPASVTYAVDPLCDPPPCPRCPCDWAPPLGVCDFSDVVAFLTGFGSLDPCACGTELPVAQCDFSDVVTFLTGFGTGCP